MTSSLVGVAKRALVTVLLSMAAANAWGDNLKNPHFLFVLVDRASASEASSDRASA